MDTAFSQICTWDVYISEIHLVYGKNEKVDSLHVPAITCLG